MYSIITLKYQENACVHVTQTRDDSHLCLSMLNEQTAAICRTKMFWFFLKSNVSCVIDLQGFCFADCRVRRFWHRVSHHMSQKLNLLCWVMVPRWWMLIIWWPPELPQVPQSCQSFDFLLKQCEYQIHSIPKPHFVFVKTFF